MKLELSELTKKELKECYETLRRELAQSQEALRKISILLQNQLDNEGSGDLITIKIRERDVLSDKVSDLEDYIDAINTLIRLSIPDPEKEGEDG